MTERAQSGGTLPNACPFLALDEDRDRRSDVPDGRHRCYAEPTPHPRALTYQESFCLSAAFPSCRSFLDWAARAAAEPLPGQSRAAGAASQPLAPIPAPVTPPPAAPGSATRPPLNPIVPPASVLPPPPPTYAPPPAWQPPGTPPPDTSTFMWATPPPWVGTPEMRSTASLPDSARPPLDAERLGWTTSSNTPALPAAPLDEGTDSYPEWPPAPRTGQVTGTFGSRRAPEPFAPLPPVAAGPVTDAPPMAALVAADLPPDLDDDPGTATASFPAAPQAPVMPSAAPEAGWSAAPVAAPTAPPAPPVARGSSGGATDATGDWGAWTDEQDPPDAWPQAPAAPGAWPAEPVAIPVGNGPAGPSAASAAWQGVMADPGTGSVPIEAAPPPSTPPPSTPPPPDAVPPGRRGPSSRWLPSFLSKEGPTTDTGATQAVSARTGPAPAVSASAVMTGEAVADETADTADTTGTTDAWIGAPVTPATGSWPASPAAAPDDPSLITGTTATAAATSPPAPDDDPPGALAPRRRRQPPGVPVDSNAPAAVGAQASRSRTKGSGEWNQPKAGASRGGWRRIIPGVIPPVALGAMVLFLGAALLFLMPGFLAGTGATPTPAPTEDPGGILASGRPERSLAPLLTEPPLTEFQTYTVKSGDTLIDIARQFSVSQEALICANRQLRRNPNLLSVGQELQIPPEDWTCPAPAKTKKP